MPRNNQNTQSGGIVTGAVVGTGSAVSLLAAQGAGNYVDLLSLVLTNTTPATNAVATVSDGTVSYVFNVGQPVSINWTVPLKATTTNTAWTINTTAAVNAVVQGVILSL